MILLCRNNIPDFFSSSGEVSRTVSWREGLKVGTRFCKLAVEIVREFAPVRSGMEIALVMSYLKNGRMASADESSWSRRGLAEPAWWGWGGNPGKNAPQARQPGARRAAASLENLLHAPHHHRVGEACPHQSLCQVRDESGPKT